MIQVEQFHRRIAALLFLSVAWVACVVTLYYSTG